MNRKYSVAEIDRMRSAIFFILTPPLMPYQEQDRKEEIERHLRTYMANGTEPAELEEMVFQIHRARDNIQIAS